MDTLQIEKNKPGFYLVDFFNSFRSHAHAEYTDLASKRASFRADLRYLRFNTPDRSFNESLANLRYNTPLSDFAKEI